ncbi:hypothetical protein [Pseudomonas sp. GV071]|uniref:hypothetical protein n=1 Tax=Pseudomonas sp. GV071 TaxID=2135754 RepID=UPI000D387B10|nr:hypothetical protein [Pseudomonas sp. GV071]PTQ74273.1 hypothetical protein C8K61_101713 [Pseudomonas sp. GV071]
MRPVPQDATDLLQGTLESPSNGPGQSSMRITNALPFGVYVYELTSTGDFAGLPNNGTAATPGSPGALLTPGNSLNFGQYNQGAYFLVTAAYSGGFVCVFQANESGSNLEINTELLLEPNAIGPIPQPNATQVIPPDSQCVVVGCGVAGPNNAVAVVREQYWRRLPDSYTIAPGQSKTISFTTVEGMQSTSSSQVTIAAQIGTSASAGWGPVSASVSASLSASSTTFQQLTLSSETTSYVSETLTGMTANSSDGSGPTTQMYLYWQLMDIINIVDPSSNLVLGSIVSGAKPVVISGPFDPNALPPLPTPAPQATSAAERRKTWVGSRLVPRVA